MEWLRAELLNFSTDVDPASAGITMHFQAQAPNSHHGFSKIGFTFWTLHTEEIKGVRLSKRFEGEERRQTYASWYKKEV